MYLSLDWIIFYYTIHLYSLTFIYGIIIHHLLDEEDILSSIY
jgi:hypothetical protein